jgi:hypothetical protein
MNLFGDRRTLMRSIEDLRSSPVSGLMTFDKRDFSNPSATSLMRYGILRPALPFGNLKGSSEP